ncbi:hypothetical protein [Aliiglaciecola sp. LCG003]|uniref:hypothetical protein n=1 Tax=Aliiglaciecola sp. LCG003 TaxID=3053655 RepID=UPI0025723871|nr:hypothetical protein [Aliiglaciecola sp. LCG003]WJG11106.1 hypothetical protein QR722_08790 [Aliiglaciecola sp. LCG003]
MGNRFGNAYGLTVLIPVKQGTENNRSYDKIIRDQLQKWPKHADSPLAAVPNTYLARVFLLQDVFYQSAPAVEEHLKSKYLVFTSNFFGDLDTYLYGMWEAIHEVLTPFLRHCVAFEKVTTAAGFVSYIKKCKINNSLFFNGANDKPLPEQLKALYVKQVFIHFAYLSQQFRYQGAVGAVNLQKSFKNFVALIDIENLQGKSWPIAATQVPEYIETDVENTIVSHKELQQ